MKLKFLLSTITLLVLFALPSRALAKGPADQVTIDGPGLANPIVITDPNELAPFSPWMDQFFDPKLEILPAPAKSSPIYQIDFFLKDDAGKLQLFYSFQYAPGAQGQPGAIYLPGRGEAEYQRNIGTILRDGLDGHWIRSSQSWDRFMQLALARTPGAGGLARTGMARSFFPQAVTGLAATLALFIGVIWIIISRRKRTA